jgi:N6-L-threonylcarbamoyladenine synthase
LKTALLRLSEPYRSVPAADRPARGQQPPGSFPEHQPVLFRDDAPIADFAASFQEAVVEVLAVKTARAALAHRATTVLLAGGVAANSALRQRLQHEVLHQCGDEIVVRWPPPALCTDNAAMIASAAFFALRRGVQAGWELDVQPRLPLA